MLRMVKTKQRLSSDELRIARRHALESGVIGALAGACLGIVFAAFFMTGIGNSTLGTVLVVGGLAANWAIIAAAASLFTLPTDESPGGPQPFVRGRSVHRLLSIRDGLIGLFRPQPQRIPVPIKGHAQSNPSRRTL
ncbi:MAG: hypothetical protein AAGA22_08300 [Pseudomonadota bacterium]